MAFISVIIPLYNKQDYICATLNSALAQTFTDFEIIIINDGSSDGSEAIVKKFNDARIIYVKTDNKGVSAARNNGINRAKGKVIAFLDADDIWEKQHLQTLYDLYVKYPEAGMLASRYTIKIGKGKLLKPVLLNVPDDFEGIVADAFEASLVYRLAVTSAVAVPKYVFDKIGTFNEQVTHPEDTELWIRIGIAYAVAISNAYTMVYTFDLPESWSRQKMKGRKIMDFDKFINEEKGNKSLKAFVDIYRLEYALKYRLEGEILHSQTLYSKVAAENISRKTRLLFKVPPFTLRALLRLKHWLHKKGISFSVYN